MQPQVQPAQPRWGQRFLANLRQQFTQPEGLPTLGRLLPPVVGAIGAGVQLLRGETTFPQLREEYQRRLAEEQERGPWAPATTGITTIPAERALTGMLAANVPGQRVMEAAGWAAALPQQYIYQPALGRARGVLTGELPLGEEVLKSVLRQPLLPLLGAVGLVLDPIELLKDPQDLADNVKQQYAEYMRIQEEAPWLWRAATTFAAGIGENFIFQLLGTGDVGRTIRTADRVAYGTYLATADDSELLAAGVAYLGGRAVARLATDQHLIKQMRKAYGLASIDPRVQTLQDVDADVPRMAEVYKGLGFDVGGDAIRTGAQEALYGPVSQRRPLSAIRAMAEMASQQFGQPEGRVGQAAFEAHTRKPPDVPSEIWPRLWASTYSQYEANAAGQKGALEFIDAIDKQGDWLVRLYNKWTGGRTEIPGMERVPSDIDESVAESLRRTFEIDTGGEGLAKYNADEDAKTGPLTRLSEALRQRMTGLLAGERGAVGPPEEAWVAEGDWLNRQMAEYRRPLVAERSDIERQLGVGPDRPLRAVLSSPRPGEEALIARWRELGREMAIIEQPEWQMERLKEYGERGAVGVPGVPAEVPEIARLQGVLGDFVARGELTQERADAALKLSQRWGVQRLELQKALGLAVGDRLYDAVMAPAPAEPVPGALPEAPRQPWQMTVAEYEQSERTPNFGDVVQTPDGAVGHMRGSGGLGSDRVRVVGADGSSVFATRGELTLVRREGGNRFTESADEWQERVTSEVKRLRDENADLLFKKRLTDRFKKALKAGEISESRYDEKLVDNSILSDTDYRKAEVAEQQIEEIKQTPLTVKPNVVHESFVRRALVAGKPVPPEVLADYPDLAAKYPTAPEVLAEAALPAVPLEEPPPVAPSDQERWVELHQRRRGLTSEMRAAQERGASYEVAQLGNQMVDIEREIEELRPAAEARAQARIDAERATPPAIPPEEAPPVALAEPEAPVALELTEEQRVDVDVQQRGEGGYRYCTDCTTGPASSIEAMVEKAGEVSYATFADNVNEDELDALRDSMGYVKRGEGLRLEDDYAV